MKEIERRIGLERRRESWKRDREIARERESVRRGARTSGRESARAREEERARECQKTWSVIEIQRNRKGKLRDKDEREKVWRQQRLTALVDGQ